MEPNASSNLKFHLIENRAFIDGHCASLRQQAYSLWKKEWTQIYQNLGSQSLPAAEGYFYYDVLCCLSLEGAVVGISAHRFIDFSDPLSHELEYVKSLGPGFLQGLSELNLQRAMTFESLLVAPEARKSNCKIPVSRIILHLANQVLMASRAECIVAAARTDLKVGELAQTVGYEVIEPNKSFRVFNCDLIVQRYPGQQYSNDESWAIAKRLWKNRNHSSFGSYLEVQSEGSVSAALKRIA